MFSVFLQYLTVMNFTGLSPLVLCRMVLCFVFNYNMTLYLHALAKPCTVIMSYKQLRYMYVNTLYCAFYCNQQKQYSVIFVLF